MARRTTVRSRTRKAGRKPPRKKSVSRRPPRASAARKAPRARAARPGAPKIRQGLVTHTELASADPGATRAWCQSVLGWKFGEPMPTPAGPYHMWRFDNGTGGGIRAHNPPEVPGSIPYCEVADIQTTYASALAAGATGMLEPQPLPGGMGWIAVVAAPGAVAIGFWGPK